MERNEEKWEDEERRRGVRKKRNGEERKGKKGKGKER